MPATICEWKKLVHFKVEEALPDDALKLLRKYAVTITCYDSNLCYNIIISMLVTVFMCFVKKIMCTGTQRRKLRLRMLLMN